MTTIIERSDRLRSIRKSIRIAASSGLAIGVSAMISTPAQAITFTGGELDFGVFTSSFATNVDPVPGNFFDVTFNPGGATSIFRATGSFSPTFTSGTTIGSNSPTVRFTNAGGNTYSLNQDLVLNLSAATPTSFTLRQGSTFQQADILNVATGLNTGAGLQLTGNAGSFFTNDGMDTNIPTLSFSFNDTGIPSGGLFIAQATPTSVPEPFTIVGTIIGGTAALRMRKKLASLNKD